MTCMVNGIKLAFQAAEWPIENWKWGCVIANANTIWSTKFWGGAWVGGLAQGVKKKTIIRTYLTIRQTILTN